MNILKYNRPKEGKATVTKSVSSIKEAIGLEEHLIFGQPYDGTNDVEGDLTAGNITCNNINSYGNITNTGDLETTNVTAENVTSQSVNTTDAVVTNLTVTGAAHFFELVVDKIKSAGGAVLLTPSNGFKVEKVEAVDGGYKLYWQASDGTDTTENMWRENDQALCMSMNKANGDFFGDNKYYWALVIGVGFDYETATPYHYIIVSSEDCDGTLNPEIGDEVVMCGYRGTDDEDRQSAIYISAYTSLDEGLQAPLFAQYQGIDDFSLSTHRVNWIAANGTTLQGNIKLSNGKDVDEAFIKVGDAIELSGDTIINGLLELTNSQGIVLTGDNGINTYIMGKSVGSIDDENPDSTENITLSSNINFSVSQDDDKDSGSNYTYSGTVAIGLGSYLANTQLTLKSYSLSGWGNGAFTRESSSFGIVVFNNNTNINAESYTGYPSSNISLSATPTVDGNVTLYISVAVSVSSDMYEEIKDDTSFNSGTLSITFSKPSESSIYIGNDGFKMNFNSGNKVFIGADGAFLSYGNNLIRITPSELTIKRNGIDVV